MPAIGEGQKLRQELTEPRRVLGKIYVAQFYQQPFGWPGEKVTTDMPGIVNLRQDPFERTPSIRGETLNNEGGGYMKCLLRPGVLALRAGAAASGETSADGD